jgi:hypothetical protein
MKIIKSFNQDFPVQNRDIERALILQTRVQLKQVELPTLGSIRVKIEVFPAYPSKVKCIRISVTIKCYIVTNEQLNYFFKEQMIRRIFNNLYELN